MSLPQINLDHLHGLSVLPFGAFSKNTSLVSLNFSEHPNLEIVSTNCFYQAWSLRELNLGPYIEKIDKKAFFECTSLQRLDLSNCTSLKNIGINAFENCYSFREIIFPSNSRITKFGCNAFQYCKSLQRLDLSNCTNLLNIENYVFKSCYSLREIIFPVNSRIKEIIYGAFESCTSLEILDLSNCTSLVNIGTIAFKDCYSLREIIFPVNSRIREIYCVAFKNCTSLVRLTIPASVAKINYDTFSYCTQLEEVIFEGQTEINKYAFQNCPRLTIKKLFRLPGFHYGKYSELRTILVDSQQENGTCGISLEEFEEDSNIVVILPCKHAYFEEIFHEWFLRKKICPTCKAKL